MATLSIKNVPASVVDRLRKRAELNHRSMQGELMALICKAVEAELETQRPLGSRQAGAVSIGEIAAEHRARWAKPFDHAPRAVDVIRGDRDAR
jgi:plasmid stability protein